ncbi:MAG TPA: hypothetical protein VFC63_07215 [Blastocatellia bacterium]|nr:hypothetical protein [Blastocatellia bacterium]
MVRSKTLVLILASSIMMAAISNAQPKDKSDPISGDWNATFTIKEMSAAITLNLKLDGKNVTGDVDSQHTGPGKIKGSWTGNKLTLRMDFDNHQPIEATAEIKDGKLSGEFRTEGTQGTWAAAKK